MFETISEKLRESFEIIVLNNRKDKFLIKSPFDDLVVKIDIFIDSVDRIRINLFDLDCSWLQQIIIDNTVRFGHDKLGEDGFISCIEAALLSFFLDRTEGVIIKNINSNK